MFDGHALVGDRSDAGFEPGGIAETGSDNRKAHGIRVKQDGKRIFRLRLANRLAEAAGSWSGGRHPKPVELLTHDRLFDRAANATVDGDAHAHDSEKQ
jgi:hypothetical protein